MSLCCGWYQTNTNAPHVKREEQFETSARGLRSSVANEHAHKTRQVDVHDCLYVDLRRGNLGRLPVISADVEGKRIDSC